MSYAICKKMSCEDEHSCLLIWDLSQWFQVCEYLSPCQKVIKPSFCKLIQDLKFFILLKLKIKDMII